MLSFGCALRGNVSLAPEEMEEKASLGSVESRVCRTPSRAIEPGRGQPLTSCNNSSHEETKGIRQDEEERMVRRGEKGSTKEGNEGVRIDPGLQDWRLATGCWSNRYLRCCILVRGNRRAKPAWRGSSDLHYLHPLSPPV